MKTTPAQKIINKMRDSREKDGAAWIAAKEVAVLVRARLKEKFPKTKFRVRSSYNEVNASWTDGPPQSAVDSEIGEYSFGGFDGMIDMAYSSSNWLLPDGSMEGAASSGTQGSMGTVPSYETDCPMPGAILVKYGPKYIFTRKSFSDERMEELVTAVGADYGVEIDHEKPYHSQCVQGEFLTTLAYQADRTQYESESK